MPDPSEEVAEALTDKKKPEELATSHAAGVTARANKAVDGVATEFDVKGKKDVKGDGFDPSIHVANRDGTPKMTTKGMFVMKRGLGTTKTGKVKTISSKATQEAMDQDARMCGLMVVSVLTNSAQGFMGVEWKPTDNENLMLEDSTAKAFQAWGWTDLPPGIALTLAWTQYALPRLIAEKKKGTFTRLKEKLFPKKKKAEPDSEKDKPKDDGKK
jgi:hypothetical protein